MIIIGEYQLAEVWLISFCLKATRQAENEPLIMNNNIQTIFREIEMDVEIGYPCGHAWDDMVMILI